MKLNLLTETNRYLAWIEKSWDSDVSHIGTESGNSMLTVEEFKIEADFEYDSDYKCFPHLVVVFSDGSWLIRSEFNDEPEFWDHIIPPALSVKDDAPRIKLR